MAASFALGVLLARGLGVQGFGYYSIALSVITIAGLPSEFGLPYLATREVAAAAALGDYGRLFGVLRWANRFCLIIGTFLGLAIAVGGAIAYERGIAQVGEALLFGAAIVPLIALAKLRGGALQGLQHVALGQAPAGIVRPATLSVLLGLALLANVSLTAPIAMALGSVSAAATLLVAWIWLKRRLPKRVAAEDVRGGRQWLASTIPLGLMEGMRVLQGDVSILLLGLVASPGLVGLLRIASATANVAATATAIAILASMPTMAALHAQKDHERLQKTVTAVAHLQFAGTLVVCIPLFAFPATLLRFAFGPGFEAAADPLRILMVAQLISAAFGANMWLLNMANQERKVARAMAIALVMTVLLVPSMGSLWGLSGAAYALLLSMVAWNVLTWRDANKFLGIETSIMRWPWFTTGRHSAAGERND